MARDFYDYDDLLKNFDDYTAKNTSKAKDRMNKAKQQTMAKN